MTRIGGIEIMSMFPLAGCVVLTSFRFEDKEPRALMTISAPLGRSPSAFPPLGGADRTSLQALIRNRGRRIPCLSFEIPMRKQQTDKKENRLEFCPPLSSLRSIPTEEIQTEFKRRLRNKRGYLEFE
jgi:hypothetical protein